MANNNNRKGTQQLRIIGGEWRGRKLGFTPAPGLRPTLDRFRETLFNWLMFETEGARCLDLFAGSGALGLEALSRGAAHCTFVDTSASACRQIREHLQILGCDRADVVQGDGLNWLTQTTDRFDLAFLDPPFHQGLLEATLERLLTGSYINDQGYIYIEAESDFRLSPLPDKWELARQKSAKHKVFFLIKKLPQD